LIATPSTQYTCTYTPSVVLAVTVLDGVELSEATLLLVGLLSGVVDEVVGVTSV